MTARTLRTTALLLLLALVCSHGQQVQHRQYAEIAAKHANFPQITRRALQSDGTVNNFTEACSLCSGLPVKADAIPPPYEIEGLPANLTCGELEWLTSMFPLEYTEFTPCQYFLALWEGPCCQRPASPYVCEQTVRSSILENYDASVLPLNDNGTIEVDLLVELHHISELSTKEGTVNVFVWFRMAWKDPRLAWNVGGENCTSSVTARAS